MTQGQPLKNCLFLILKHYHAALPKSFNDPDPYFLNSSVKRFANLYDGILLLLLLFSEKIRRGISYESTES